MTMKVLNTRFKVEKFNPKNGFELELERLRIFMFCLGISFKVEQFCLCTTFKYTLYIVVA